KFSGGLAPPELLNLVAHQVQQVNVRGVPASGYRQSQRPGVAALEDAAQVAEDFVFLRTTIRSLQEFIDWYGIQSLPEIAKAFLPGQCLLLRSAQHPSKLELYDGETRKIARLSVDMSEGFIQRQGIEHPAAGLIFRFQAGHSAGQEMSLRPC